MSKGKIAFDIDGVLADILLHNERKIALHYGSKARFGEPLDYGLRGLLPQGTTQEEADAFFHPIYQNPQTYAELEPINPWVNFLRIIDRFDLFGGYITRRPQSASTTTREFLHRCALPSHPDITVFCPSDEAKHDYFEEGGITCLIEDSPREAMNVARAGYDSILVRTRYTEFEDAIVSHGGCVATDPTDALLYLADRGYAFGMRGGC